ncbi:uncharacterized protein LOC142352977 isoform X2 [Convolutriloba macropyga]|uniref:uncharacterized protein LOC142352977 isoform X2 n=1 Tax=Convolutriloba macropyga TaxID=536237 RepID=UPI003F5208AB
MSFAPRYCYLEKGERGYGFNLHGEAPESNEEPISPHRTFYHVIKAVDAKSPAQYGGLKQDDRLIGVNGYYVDNKPHLDVVNLIKRGGSSAWLLVVDREADEHFYSQMKRKPAFADAVYGQQDKRGEPVDLSSVPMEEERETVESGEGEEELAAPPPDYPGNADDSEEEARENEEAINAVVSAVEDKEESSEREANDAQSSHNTSSHSAQGSQEDKENRASAADQQRIQRQLRNLDMASKLGVKVVHPVPESFRYNNKNNIRKNSSKPEGSWVFLTRSHGFHCS